MFFVTSGLYYLKSRYYDSNTGRFIKADGENCASSYVRTYTATVGSNASLTYTFTYDDSGNIIAVQVRGARSYNLSYEYDDLGQLRRENNSKLAKTFTYTYDDAGNILSKKTYAYRAGSLSGVNPTATSTYTYSSGVWGDMLTSFGGQSITYDGIGNPLTYYGGRSFTWVGRQLVSANFSGTALSFTYDDNGLRTTKTVNGVTTNYYYSGGLLVAEVSPTSSTVYIYDAYGSPIGFKYRTNSDADGVWDNFWYEKNLQGDILGVYSDDGEPLVSYKYDAWGKVTAAYRTGASDTPAMYNRLLYRGYYFEADLGLYYLQSRYYDPNTGRFISPDSIDYLGANGELNSYNLYAYCDNNPVMRVDHGGECWNVVVGAVIGVASQYISDVVYNVVSGKTGADIFKPNSSIVDYIAAGISDGLAATGIGVIGSAIANVVIDSTAYVINTAIEGKEVDALELTFTVLASVVSARSGINGKKLVGVCKQSRNVLKTAVSPQKIALYTSKIVGARTTVRNHILESLFNSVASGFVQGVLG